MKLELQEKSLKIITVDINMLGKIYREIHRSEGFGLARREEHP